MLEVEGVEGWLRGIEFGCLKSSIIKHGSPWNSCIFIPGDSWNDWEENHPVSYSAITPSPQGLPHTLRACASFRSVVIVNIYSGSCHASGRRMRQLLSYFVPLIFMHFCCTVSICFPFCSSAWVSFLSDDTSSLFPLLSCLTPLLWPRGSFGSSLLERQHCLMFKGAEVAAIWIHTQLRLLEAWRL